MYPMTMHRINRSPEAGEGGGLPAAATPEAVGSGTPAAATPEYLSKADFESKWSELGSRLDKLTPKQAAAEAKDGKPTTPQKPRISDYKMNPDNPKAEEELDRYNSDIYNYHRHMEREKDAKEASAKSAQERQEKTRKGHQARVAEYIKENPTFEADAKKANLMGEEDVTQAIFSHKESPAIIHHMTKNAALVDELNQLALSGDVYGVHQRVGELAAEIRADRKALEANAEAAGTKIPRQTFNKGSAGAKKELTLEERYERNRS